MNVADAALWDRSSKKPISRSNESGVRRDHTAMMTTVPTAIQNATGPNLTCLPACASV